MGCFKSNLEHSKAKSEVDQMDALYFTVHSGLVTSLLIQYNNSLILAAQ